MHAMAFSIFDHVRCNAESLFEVDSILDTTLREDGSRWYAVQWKPTWESAKSVSPSLILKYKKLQHHHELHADDEDHICEVAVNEYGGTIYLVKWASTWEPEENLFGSCQEKVGDFWSRRNKLPHDKDGKRVEKAKSLSPSTKDVSKSCSGTNKRDKKRSINHANVKTNGMPSRTSHDASHASAFHDIGRGSLPLDGEGDDSVATDEVLLTEEFCPSSMNEVPCLDKSKTAQDLQDSILDEGLRVCVGEATELSKTNCFTGLFAALEQEVFHASKRINSLSRNEVLVAAKRTVAALEEEKAVLAHEARVSLCRVITSLCQLVTLGWRLRRSRCEQGLTFWVSCSGTEHIVNIPFSLIKLAAVSTVDAKGPSSVVCESYSVSLHDGAEMTQSLQRPAPLTAALHGMQSACYTLPEAGLFLSCDSLLGRECAGDPRVAETAPGSPSLLRLASAYASGSNAAVDAAVMVKAGNEALGVFSRRDRSQDDVETCDGVNSFKSMYFAKEGPFNLLGTKTVPRVAANNDGIDSDAGHADLSDEDDRVSDTSSSISIESENMPQFDHMARSSNSDIDGASSVEEHGNEGAKDLPDGLMEDSFGAPGIAKKMHAGLDKLLNRLKAALHENKELKMAVGGRDLVESQFNSEAAAARCEQSLESSLSPKMLCSSASEVVISVCDAVVQDLRKASPDQDSDRLPILVNRCRDADDASLTCTTSCSVSSVQHRALDCMVSACPRPPQVLGSLSHDTLNHDPDCVALQHQSAPQEGSMLVDISPNVASARHTIAASMISHASIPAPVETSSLCSSVGVQSLQESYGGDCLVPIQSPDQSAEDREARVVDVEVLANSRPFDGNPLPALSHDAGINDGCDDCNDSYYQCDLVIDVKSPEALYPELVDIEEKNVPLSSERSVPLLPAPSESMEETAVTIIDSGIEALLANPGNSLNLGLSQRTMSSRGCLALSRSQGPTEKSRLSQGSLDPEPLLIGKEAVSVDRWLNSRNVSCSRSRSEPSCVTGPRRPVTEGRNEHGKLPAQLGVCDTAQAVDGNISNGSLGNKNQEVYLLRSIQPSGGLPQSSAVFPSPVVEMPRAACIDLTVDVDSDEDVIIVEEVSHPAASRHKRAIQESVTQGTENVLTGTLSMNRFQSPRLLASRGGDGHRASHLIQTVNKINQCAKKPGLEMGDWRVPTLESYPALCDSSLSEVISNEILSLARDDAIIAKRVALTNSNDKGVVNDVETGSVSSMLTASVANRGFSEHLASKRITSNPCPSTKRTSDLKLALSVKRSSETPREYAEVGDRYLPNSTPLPDRNGLKKIKKPVQARVFEKIGLVSGKLESCHRESAAARLTEVAVEPNSSQKLDFMMKKKAKLDYIALRLERDIMKLAKELSPASAPEKVKSLSKPPNASKPNGLRASKSTDDGTVGAGNKLNLSRVSRGDDSAIANVSKSVAFKRFLNSDLHYAGTKRIKFLTVPPPLVAQEASISKDVSNGGRKAFSTKCHASRNAMKLKSQKSNKYLVDKNVQAVDPRTVVCPREFSICVEKIELRKGISSVQEIVMQRSPVKRSRTKVSPNCTRGPEHKSGRDADCEADSMALTSEQIGAPPRKRSPGESDKRVPSRVHETPSGATENSEAESFLRVFNDETPNPSFSADAPSRLVVGKTDSNTNDNRRQGRHVVGIDGNHEDNTSVELFASVAESGSERHRVNGENEGSGLSCSADDKGNDLSALGSSGHNPASDSLRNVMLSSSVDDFDRSWMNVLHSSDSRHTTAGTLDLSDSVRVDTDDRVETSPTLETSSSLRGSDSEDLDKPNTDKKDRIITIDSSKLKRLTRQISLSRK